MRSRLPGFAALAGVALLVACMGDPAAPTVNLTTANTSGMVVKVFMNQSLTAVPAFVADTGLTRINLYKQGDTTLLQSLTTPSSGGGRIPVAARGIINFFGLLPGTYVLRPSLRKFSSASSTTSLVAQIGDSAVVTVAAGGLDTTSIFQVRLGSSVSGTIGIQWTDSIKLNTVRLPLVNVVLQRETVAASGIYVDTDSTTTDAIGAFSIPLKSVGGSMGTRLRTNFTTVGCTVCGTVPDPTLFNLGGFVAPPGAPGSVLSPAGVATWTQAGATGGNNTNQNITVAAPLLFQFSSFISGRAFRDANTNGVYDAGGPEDMVAGDTIVVQLRNNDVTPAGTRVITTSRAVATANASYSFANLRAGNYILTVDLLTSRVNGKRLMASPSIAVNVPTSSFRYTNTPVAPAVANPKDVGVAIPP